jgi:hypothetical protein
MEEPKCKGEGPGRGIHVRTWAETPDCRLSGHDNVRHIVEVENLQNTPITVACVGSINSDTKFARFHCDPPRGEVTDSRWESNRSAPGDQTITFRHVTLCGEDTSAEETIETEVTTNGVFGCDFANALYLIDT